MNKKLSLLFTFFILLNSTTVVTQNSLYTQQRFDSSRLTELWQTYQMPIVGLTAITLAVFATFYALQKRFFTSQVEELTKTTLLTSTVVSEEEEKKWIPSAGGYGAPTEDVWEELPTEEKVPLQQLTPKEFYDTRNNKNTTVLNKLYEKIVYPFEEIIFRGEPIEGIEFNHPNLEIVQLKVLDQITKNSCAYEVLFTIWCLQQQKNNGTNLSNMLYNKSLRADMIKNWSATTLVERYQNTNTLPQLFTQITTLLKENITFEEIKNMLEIMDKEAQIEFLQERLRHLDDIMFTKILHLYLDNLEGEELIKVINAEMPNHLMIEEENKTMPNLIDTQNNQIIVFTNKGFINQVYLPHVAPNAYQAIKKLRNNIVYNIPSILSCIALTSDTTAAHWILLEIHTFKDHIPQLILADSLQNERVFNDEIVRMFVDLIIPGQNIYYEVVYDDNFTKDKLLWAIDYGAQQVKRARTEEDREFYLSNYFLLRDRYFNMTGQQAREYDVWN